MTDSPPASPSPLVSILIPTHDRPDFLALALQSARAQTYENIEILISDNGDTPAREAIADQLAADPRVRYLVPEGSSYMENWLNAFGQARGHYVGFLMDDDLFHPSKVARMVPYFEAYPLISLVTSYRQLIDEHGGELPAIPDTARLFEKDTVVSGNAMAEHMIKCGMNLIGEPTTAMFRRADVGAGFGRFCDRHYPVMSDLATWMSLLRGRLCAYLPDPLSYFRLHDGQDQRKKSTAINANLEWLQMLMDARKLGMFGGDDSVYRTHLSNKLQVLLPFLAAQHAEIRAGDYALEEIHRLVRRALGELWQ